MNRSYRDYNSSSAGNGGGRTTPVVSSQQHHRRGNSFTAISKKCDENLDLFSRSRRTVSLTPDHHSDGQSLSLSFDFVLSVSSGSNISTKFVMVPAYAFSFINLYYQSILILNSDVLVSIFLKKLLLQILPISLLLYSSDT